MYLFADGARLGYGLGSVKNDLTLEKLAELTDVFYIGGTKCGALFGEALVITNKKLARKFRTYMKQNGAVMAKGWLLGMQFCSLLEDGTYEKMTAQADAYALEIKAAFKEKGIREYVESYLKDFYVQFHDAPQKDLYKAMEYSLLGGGKRLRPIFAFEFCRMAGGTRNAGSMSSRSKCSRMICRQKLSIVVIWAN